MAERIIHIEVVGDLSTEGAFEFVASHKDFPGVTVSGKSRAEAEALMREEIAKRESDEE